MNGVLVGGVGLRVLMCVGCGDERGFEQPPCLDGHDVCAEWACVDCGYAVFLDPEVFLASELFLDPAVALDPARVELGPETTGPARELRAAQPAGPRRNAA